MEIIRDPCCNLCSLKAQGTYIHMFWDCPPVQTFWNNVASKHSGLTHETVPVTLCVLILDDLSVLNISKLKKRIVFAGLTAAKKMIVTRWKPPHSLSTQSWVLSFLDVIYMELSTARINGANEATLNTWRSAAESLKNMI